MAIVASEIKWKTSAVQSDAVPTTNGGGMTSTAIPSTYFPDVKGSERISGITRYRKGYVKQENVSGGYVGLTLNNAKIYLRAISAADDYFRLAAATDNYTTFTWDVQDPDAEAITSWSGVGTLDQDIETGFLSIDVEAENPDGFAPTAEIVIFNSADPTDFEIAIISTVNWTGNIATLGLQNPILFNWPRAYITFTGATTITSTSIGKTGIDLGAVNSRANQLIRVLSGPGAGQTRRIISNTTEVATINYGWDPLDMPTGASTVEIVGTVVSQLIPVGNIVASSANWAESNSNGGIYNEGTYPVKLFPVGTTADGYTIQFTALNICNVIRDSDGQTLQTGVNITTTNPKPANGGSYYFELDRGGFAGTWTTGDSLYFTTKHSATGFWVKHITPASSDPHAGVMWDVGVIGDTA